MSIVLPNTLVNGTNADATQVNENFEAVVAAIEGIGTATTATDAYQAGVVAATDWVPTSVTINGATGAIQAVYGAGGSAWLPAPAGGLVRTFVGSGIYGLVPPALPGPGGYMNMGIELAPSGSVAAVSVVAGAEQGSEAAAITNGPAVSAGKVRILNVIVKNTAGVYSLIGGAQRDRRPWARGLNSSATQTNPEESTAALLAAPAAIAGLSMRVECSGAPLLVVFSASRAWSKTAAASVNVQVRDETKAVRAFGEWQPTAAVTKAPLTVVSEYVPAAGSHLLEAVFCTSNIADEVTLVGSQLIVVELVRQRSNNGTS